MADLRTGKPSWSDLDRMLAKATERAADLRARNDELAMERDKARAEVAALRAQVAEAADVARKAERADVVAHIDSMTEDGRYAGDDDTYSTLVNLSLAIENGHHEGAADPK